MIGAVVERCASADRSRWAYQRFLTSRALSSRDSPDFPTFPPRDLKDAALSAAAPASRPARRSILSLSAGVPFGMEKMRLCTSLAACARVRRLDRCGGDGRPSPDTIDSSCFSNPRSLRIVARSCRFQSHPDLCVRCNRSVRRSLGASERHPRR
jgi:hypothetical protein